ncbi:hypothetical protein V2H45_18550 [Tumidithrix elongata RA019]|uniref:Secreted protein n=1 Tax=Tumidithrix elongata BACA0141 TaxID=2716417 RepID=A0AAW9PUT6_9CYAN|nr:hypothetical protein [Tumidithrix elongata RA019]
MSTRFCLLASSIAIASMAIAAAPSFANPYRTNQDAYPNNYPAVYPQVYTKVLDMTSDINLPNPYIQFEYRDQEIGRQTSAFRAVNQEMMDLQTMSDPTLRTRDLPNVYCSSLLAEGFNSCAAPVVEAEPVVVPRYEPPAPAVPALW